MASLRRSDAVCVRVYRFDSVDALIDLSGSCGVHPRGKVADVAVKDPSEQYLRIVLSFKNQLSGLEMESGAIWTYKSGGMVFAVA